VKSKGCKGERKRLTQTKTHLRICVSPQILSAISIPRNALYGAVMDREPGEETRKESDPKDFSNRVSI
jgi:hypothetical protein